jgi:hypothetical protein
MIDADAELDDEDMDDLEDVVGQEKDLTVSTSDKWKITMHYHLCFRRATYNGFDVCMVEGH